MHDEPDEPNDPYSCPCYQGQYTTPVECWCPTVPAPPLTVPSPPPELEEEAPPCP